MQSCEEKKTRAILLTWKNLDVTLYHIVPVPIQSNSWQMQTRQKGGGGEGGALPQSRQSAKTFLQSSELGLPHPLIRRRVCPPLVPGGEGAQSLAGEGGGVPIPTRGQILWYSRYICPLWALPFVS